MRGIAKSWVVALAGMFFTAASWCSSEGVKAPHGGRLMEAGKLKVEFHLDKGRKANLYLYDSNLKPLPPDTGRFILWTVLKTGAKKVALVKGASGVVSSAALPTPGGYPIILSVKEGAKPVKLRFKLLEDNCGGCNLPEYACICGH